MIRLFLRHRSRLGPFNWLRRWSLFFLWRLLGLRLLLILSFIILRQPEKHAGNLVRRRIYLLNNRRLRNLRTLIDDFREVVPFYDYIHLFFLFLFYQFKDRLLIRLILPDPFRLWRWRCGLLIGRLAPLVLVFAVAVAAVVVVAHRDLVENHVVGQITHFRHGHLPEIKFLDIEFLELALNKIIICGDTILRDQAHQKDEFMKMEGWLHLFAALLIHHRAADGGVGILIFNISFHELIIVVEF